MQKAKSSLDLQKIPSSSDQQLMVNLLSSADSVGGNKRVSVPSLAAHMNQVSSYDVGAAHPKKNFSIDFIGK